MLQDSTLNLEFLLCLLHMHLVSTDPIQSSEQGVLLLRWEGVQLGPSSSPSHAQSPINNVELAA